MAQNLNQNFVNLRRLRLAPQAFPELALDHAERRFNVTPLVIVRHERVLIEHEEVIHLCPYVRRGRVRRLRVRLERNVRRPAMRRDKSQVAARRVSFIAGHLLQREVRGGGADERRKVRAVARVRVRHFHGRHNVSSNARADVNLHPILPADIVRLLVAVERARLTPLGIIPALINAPREARRVHGKVTLDSLQRHGRLRDQLLEVGRQFFLLKILGERLCP